MAKNRNLPFGYRIVGGKTVAEPEEAKIIRRIYRLYAAGISYKAIALALTSNGVRYMPDKPVWNKNMVARILQNQNYLGTEKYPAIVKSAAAEAARQAQKPYTHTESEDIKALKSLLVCGICGEPVKRRLKSKGGERWYCDTDTKHIAVALTDETLLQSIATLGRYLIQNPQLAESEAGQSNQASLAAMRLQNELDLMLEQETADATEVQAKIMELAAERYAHCRDCDNDSKDILCRLRKLAPTAKLDSDFIKEITAEIRVADTAATALVLKNGQIIGKGEQHHE